MQQQTEVECPKCKAPAGEPCVRGGKALKNPHVERLRVVEAEQQAPAPVPDGAVPQALLLSIACPTCKAPVGGTCHVAGYALEVGCYARRREAQKLEESTPGELRCETCDSLAPGGECPTCSKGEGEDTGADIGVDTSAPNTPDSQAEAVDTGAAPEGEEDIPCSVCGLILTEAVQLETGFYLQGDAIVCGSCFKGEKSPPAPVEPSPPQAQAEPDVVQSEVTKEVMFKVPVTEREALLREMFAAEQEIADIHAAAVAEAKEVKKKLKKIRAELKDGRAKEVKCLETRDYAHVHYTLVVLESGEIVEDRALTAEELEQRMLPIAPKAAAAPGPAEPDPPVTEALPSGLVRTESGVAFDADAIYQGKPAPEPAPVPRTDPPCPLRPGCEQWGSDRCATANGSCLPDRCPLDSCPDGHDHLANGCPCPEAVAKVNAQQDGTAADDGKEIDEDEDTAPETEFADEPPFDFVRGDEADDEPF